jgi:DNA polymerase III subunit gamma/tau
MALYLKYRPQKINDLDLEKVRDSLVEILGSKEIPHAFLFCGPKGTGKTSSARILAKSVNCQDQKKGEPCNKCSSCKAITEGRCLDLIEIDAASNRGIDDIRELKSKINLVPSMVKTKVYIIDEAHMLTNEAFNALLKTLEEPPEQVKFVLCTTEPNKLPGTIVSRCFQVQFDKAKTEELVRSLSRVVKGEKIEIKKEDLVKIANKAGGSFRDAVKVLEQLAVKNKRVSTKRVDEGLDRGMTGRDINDLVKLTYEGEAKKAVEWLNQAVEAGVDVKQLGIELVERLRELLLNKLGIISIEVKDDYVDAQRLRECLIKANQAIREIKTAVIEVLPLELMMVDLRVDQAETEKEPPKPKVSLESGKLMLSSVKSKWQAILESLRPQNHSLEALLRATKPTGFDGKYLVLEVFYKFHKERLEAERYRKMVEETASKVLNQPINVRFYLGEKTDKVIVKNVDDNITAKIDNDIIKTAEEVFGVEVN